MVILSYILFHNKLAQALQGISKSLCNKCMCLPLSCFRLQTVREPNQYLFLLGKFRFIEKLSNKGSLDKTHDDYLSLN